MTTAQLADLRAQHQEWLRFEQGKAPHNRRSVGATMQEMRQRAKRRRTNAVIRGWLR